MESLKELISQLNSTDECTNIEAKRASDVGKSIMETVCSFSNEPSLGGGYILLGVEKEDNQKSLFPEYIVTGIPFDKLDEIQTNLASQCSDFFNKPIRPTIKVEQVDGKNVVIVFVEELSPENKPLYIKSRGLPQGAYRRVGSADVKGTEDDMGIYFSTTESFDSTVVKDAELDDILEDSILLYRKFRSEVNSSAEELQYVDIELLRSIHAIKKKGKDFFITYTGLLTFGSRPALRRLLPMVRVDYIRVSTNEWVEDANNRFTSTLDMRGSLLELVQRIIHTIGDDLPKGFELTDENIQAKNIGLPLRVLREAVVNALIHRSYKENSPIQIIRYPNRIEIINPGFSLKTEEQLGEPGSVNRNPYISAIFHETNLAETKGSGIRTMRRLMEGVSMMPPTFESDRENNRFTVRLLLHHLLNEKDLEWLKNFDSYNLTDNQKRILIFIRELGAVDNSSARQINGSDSKTTNSDLRKLRELDLLDTKGRNRYTYYIPTSVLKSTYSDINVDQAITPVEGLSAPAKDLSALPSNLSALAINLSTLAKDDIDKLSLIKNKIDTLPARINDKAVIKNIILELCSIKEFKMHELTVLLNKSEKYIFRDFVKPLLEQKELGYKFPDMITHPDQAYLTLNK